MKGLLPVFFVFFLACLSPIFGDVYDSSATEREYRERFHPKAVMEAFALAYPERIERSGFYRGEWGVLIDGTWYLYAEARFLPEDVLFSPDYDPDTYAHYPLYRYSKELPPLRELSDLDIQRLEERLEERRENPPYRHPGLFNSIWRIDSSRTAWERMKTTFFLGKKVLIHRDLLEDLAGIEEDILEAAKTNSAVQRYVDSIVSATGFNYRRIAGTRSLSFHSYGFAVDILPRSYDGREVYWRWAWESGLDWYALPYEQRYMPPMKVIEIWENHGFVWGGKWFHFDSMHFEYRPEILLLNGF